MPDFYDINAAALGGLQAGNQAAQTWGNLVQSAQNSASERAYQASVTHTQDLKNQTIQDEIDKATALRNAANAPGVWTPVKPGANTVIPNAIGEKVTAALGLAPASSPATTTQPPPTDAQSAALAAGNGPLAPEAAQKVNPATVALGGPANPAPVPALGLSAIGGASPAAPQNPTQVQTAELAPFVGGSQSKAAKALAALPNAADTSVANGDTPTHADTQVTPMGTFNRQAFLQSLADQGRSDLIPEHVAAWTQQDQQAQLAKTTEAVRQHALLVSGFAAFNALPDSMKPAAYQDEVKALASMGVPIGSMPPTYDPSNPQTVAFMKNMENQATSAMDKAKIAHEAAQDAVSKQNADTAATNANAASSAEGKIREDEKDGTLSHADAQAALANLHYHAPVAGAGAAALPAGSTARDYADAMLQGRSSWPTGRELMDPVKKAGLALAMSEDKTLDQNTFNLRQKAYTDSVNGKGGQTLSSVDTALLHLGNYVKNAPNIPDSGSKFVNYAYQPLREATSHAASEALGNASTDQTTLADELESAYRNGGGTEKGIGYFRDMLNPKLPESTRLSNAQEMASLVMGKRNETVNRINRAFPPGKGLTLPMSPEASSALDFIKGKGKTTFQPIPVAQSGMPDMTTLGKNPRFPDAVWATGGKANGWYHKNADGTTTRVE